MNTSIIQTPISQEKRSTFLASLGSAIEYYDFIIYGMLAKYLKAVFFPADNDSIAVIQFFSIFAIGYLARPFGGIFAGMLGDRFGRKPVFLTLTIAMALSTFLIGIIPSYSQMGIIAPMTLCLCRFMQGLSFGGELPGATTMVAEFALSKRRSLSISILIASVSLGALSASFILFLMTSFLNDASIIAWGWRLPFILGGIFGILLFFARQNLIETPVFQTQNSNEHLTKPLILLFRNHTSSVLRGLGLTVFVSAMVVVNLYFPYHINKYFYFSEKEIYFSTTLSLIFAAVFLPLAGHLVDRSSKEIILKWTTVSYLILSIPFFKLLNFQSLPFLILFMFIHQFYISLFSACYFPLMVQLFPPTVRYTGIALCYNLMYVIMSNLPASLTALLNHFKNPTLVPIALSSLAACSFITIVWHEYKVSVIQRA